LKIIYVNNKFNSTSKQEKTPEVPLQTSKLHEKSSVQSVCSGV